MGETTGISWTDHTFNIVWGCERVSPGCAHCYAADLSARYGFDVWGKGPKQGKGHRRILSASYWQQPLRWHRHAQGAGKPAKVFCASMADVFEDHPIVAREREKLWPLIEETTALTWLLLTKRPEQVLHMVPLPWLAGFPANVWIGTSVENQHWADIRIPQLLDIPAKVRFLSCEPLLGPVDLSPWLPIYKPEEARRGDAWGQIPWSPSAKIPIYPLHWIIVGGESGPKHRPMHPEWARDIRDQCAAADIPFFFKQWGGVTSKSGGDLLDGQQYHAWPQVA